MDSKNRTPKREIKFRAWDKHKKVFIPNDVYAIINRTDFDAFGIMIKNWDDYIVGEFFYDNAQEISQFTGLHDKNGRDIYENDILLFTDDEGSQWNGQVIFHNLSWMVKLFKTEQQVISPDLLSEYSDPDYVTFEVIGNIYEHKHLLQDEK